MSALIYFFHSRHPYSIYHRPPFSLFFPSCSPGILDQDLADKEKKSTADQFSPNRDGVQDRKRLVRIALVILPVTYVACLLIAFFKCVPFDKQWQIYPNPGSK